MCATIAPNAAAWRSRHDPCGGKGLWGRAIRRRCERGGRDRDPIALYRDGRRQEEKAGRTAGAAACSCPMLFLVDARTHSAAEMLTLALRGHGVAHVVGQPTVGGLTVPRYVPLADGYVRSLA
jgi:C-terminal processing protease CtpA/Prc